MQFPLRNKHLMASLNLHDHFLAIWRRALNQPTLDSLTPTLIKSWATERRLSVQDAEERDIGPFGKTKSIVLTVQGHRACFPKVGTKGDPTWEQRRCHANREAALWEKMEWFLPLWVPMRDIQELLQGTADCSKERAIELFDYHTSTIYTLPFQAVCIAQIMPQPTVCVSSARLLAKRISHFTVGIERRVSLP